MLGRQIKELREARCWSQTHLAAAAGLNVRTVQRIEAEEPCSYETLMSLAAALDVDLATLEQAHVPTRKAVGSLRASLAAACLGPLLLFVIVNLLRSGLHVSAPYDAFAKFGGELMSFRTFNLVSPVVFIGGGIVALAMSSSAFVSIRRKVDGSTVRITAVELTSNWSAIALFILALGCLGLMFGYVALEQLLTSVR